MICRFCGKKTESVIECPHCSHESPVSLSYKSYLDDPIIDKLSSVLLTSMQKDEITSNSSHEPILLDAESALQMLQSDHVASEETTEITAQSVPRIGIDKEETELKHDDDSPTSKYLESVFDEHSTTSETSELDHNDAVPKQEDEPMKVESDKNKVEEKQNSESSSLLLRLRFFIQKHLLLVCVILVCASLVIGFAIGYSVAKRNKNNDIPTESSIQANTTTTTSSEQITDNINDSHRTEANTDGYITTKATDDDTITTESITDMSSDYGVRDAVLREKESEEIQ